MGSVSADALVPFVSQQLQNLDLAMALARRGNLPGAEGLVVQQFQRLYGAGQYKEAAELAAESPQGVLRTAETIESFKRVPAAPGQTSPLLVYFGTILTKSSLNPLESVELGRLVIQQNKKQLLDNWWKVRGGRGSCGAGGGRVAQVAWAGAGCKEASVRACAESGFLVQALVSGTAATAPPGLPRQAGSNAGLAGWPGVMPLRACFTLHAPPTSPGAGGQAGGQRGAGRPVQGRLRLGHRPGHLPAGRRQRQGGRGAGSQGRL